MLSKFRLLGASGAPSSAHAPRAVPWLAAAALWALFELPTLISQDGVNPLALRPTGEALLLATAALLSARAKLGPRPIAAVGAAALLLLVLRVDFTLYNLAMRAEPLLYDQLYTIRHFLVLITDLFTLDTALRWLLLAAIGAVTVLLVRALCRRLPPLATDRSRSAARALAAAWAVVLPLTALSPRDAEVPWVRWMVPELVTNVQRSLSIHRALQSGLAASPYRAFRDVRLRQKPDVLVFFVESYGRVFAEDPHTAARWAADLGELERRLSARGWCTASGFSTAPVSGGASWMAVGSIFFGTKIRYQGVFQRLVDAGPSLPAVPRFFDQQGYTTVNLAPSVRPRPGVESENRYQYRTYLRLPDLDYRGPKMGWGIVPDQYALGVAEEKVLSHVRGPLFFHFHMVSSHFSWESVPTYVQDWREWNTHGEELARRSAGEARTAPASGAAFKEAFWDGYERGVFYDFRLIEEFLSRRSRDTVVVVMGDHQPFMLTSRRDSFDAPVHLISRDPAALEEFVDRGFTPGMVPPVKRPPQVKHEGLFSLLVRALARAHGDASRPLPEYHPDGVPVGD